MTIGISTAYFIDHSKSWDILLKNAKKFDFDNFELSVETPAAWLPVIKKSVMDGKARVLSIHNYCPKLENLPKERNIFNGYLLTSEDKEERKNAIDFTKKTIGVASELWASTVIIHVGEVTLDLSGRSFVRYLEDFGVNSRFYQAHLEELRKTRATSAERYLLTAITSLKEIVTYAEDKNVNIGLENRFFYHEIPLLDEFGVIFSEVNSKNIGFWYDVGHGEIFVRMGFMTSHRQLLETYKDKILGFHLHDVRGLKDHWAPGEGELDYSQFEEYFSPGTLKIIESHPHSSSNALKKSPLLFNVKDRIKD